MLKCISLFPFVPYGFSRNIEHSGKRASATCFFMLPFCSLIFRYVTLVRQVYLKLSYRKITLICLILSKVISFIKDILTGKTLSNPTFETSHLWKNSTPSYDKQNTEINIWEVYNHIHMWQCAFKQHYWTTEKHSSMKLLFW